MQPMPALIHTLKGQCMDCEQSTPPRNAKWVTTKELAQILGVTASAVHKARLRRAGSKRGRKKKYSFDTRTAEGQRLARIMALPGYNAQKHDAHVKRRAALYGQLRRQAHNHDAHVKAMRAQHQPRAALQSKPHDAHVKAFKADDARRWRAARNALRLRKRREMRAAARGRPIREYKKSGNSNSPEYKREYKRLARLKAMPGFTPRKHDAHVKAWKANEKKQKEEAAKNAKLHAGLHNAHVRTWVKAMPGDVFRHKYRTDPEFNLKERLRARTRKAIEMDSFLSRHVSAYVKSHVLRGSKSKKFFALVGYGLSDLAVHLESLFCRGMTWEAFLTGNVHIDHIKPRSSFDLNDPEQLKQCWALSNLQPLWAHENLIKGARSNSEFDWGKAPE